MTAPLLAVDKLEVVYQRAITAVQGITLSVGAGQIVGIVGSNGAGKTTLLRAISGFHGLDDAHVSAGTIRFKGEAIENRQPHRIARLGIGLVPERDKVFPNLTVAENLLVPATGSVRRPQLRQRQEQMLHLFPQLAGLRHRLAGLLSGGERQMLALAAALVSRPQLLLVDELSLGLAPTIVADLGQRLLQIRKDLGLAIAIVEQSAAVALDLADHSYVMENGRIVLDGDSQRLRGHPDVQEFYLGLSLSGKRRSYRDVKQYRRSRRWYG